MIAHHPPIQAVNATAYSHCSSSGTFTASGYRPRFGQIANNWMSFGTRVHLTHPLFGRRHFYVRDRIGQFSQMDFYMGCQDAINFGRRVIRYWIER